MITVAKGAPKIAKADPSPVDLPGTDGRPSRGFNVRNSTMADFAGAMQNQFMDQPVVDQTGLGDQRYNFVLKWTLDAAQLNRIFGGAPPPNTQSLPNGDAPPDLFTAMQQQLGLQMKSGKAPVDVMIIDMVGKPTPN